MLESVLNWLSGKKTYFVAAGILVYALLGWSLGYLMPQEAINLIWTALGMVGFRSALSKLESK